MSSQEPKDPSPAQILLNKYPLLYPNGIVELGFYLEPGWFKLVDTLSSLLDDQIERAPEEIRGELYAIQVKEKFGGLRFYMNKETPFISGAISLAESLSFQICQKCGKDGMPRTTGWIRTLCDDHHKEIIKHL